MANPSPTLHRSLLLRPVSIGAACMVVVGAVLWLGFASRNEVAKPPAEAAPQLQAALAAPAIAPTPASPPPAAAAQPQAAPVRPPIVAAIEPPPASPGPTVVAQPQAAPARPLVAASAAPPAAPPADSEKPSFDIVRVNPQGNAVIAGRAAPGTQVTVADNGHDIGKTQADAQGQWVILPAAPIGPGGSELTVASQAQDQQPVKGDAPVVVLMPDKPKPNVVASAAPTTLASPAAPPAAPIVVLTPSDAAPRLLQPPPTESSSAKPSGHLGLATVDYSDQGDIRFAGTAPPGATVRTYVDNQPAGDAAADAQGHWTLMPPAGMAAGDHQLRLDQIGRDGRVTTRLELPFQRAELSPQQLAEGRIVVQPGQNLWRIARHAYGHGVQYMVIYEVNHDQIRDPNLIYPGQAFTVPTSR